MLLEEKIIKVPEWSLNDKLNRWCDYIELRCLYGKDKIVTKDDVLSLFIEGEDDSGEECHSGNFDKKSAQIDVIFEQIRYRSEAIPKFYPFNYSEGCLNAKNKFNANNMQYIMLLMSSCIAFMDESSRTSITKYFEEYCLPIFKYLVSSDSEVHIFGTSKNSNFFVGNLRVRVQKLAECFNAQTTKTFDVDPKYDVAGGDAGIDLVAFNKIDEASHIPIALAQCTCSYTNWEIKQESVNMESFTQKIMPVAPFGQYMFVSFFCRNATGKFENPTTITTCLIDRLRIIKLIDRHQELYDYIDFDKQIGMIKHCCGETFYSALNISIEDILDYSLTPLC